MTAFQPDWPAPRRVRCFQSTRQGGVSVGPYASLNLGLHVGDDPQAVAENRHRLEALSGLQASPHWMTQVHGTRVLMLDQSETSLEADAAVSFTSGRVCTVMTADCLPVLFCEMDGAVVAAAHAGWRGLAAGVLEATLAAMQCAPARTMAWMGPAIGPAAFEVGQEVRQAFVGAQPSQQVHFRPAGVDKYHADLFGLARQRLLDAGIRHIYGGGVCTYTQALDFFSHRRDKTSGRMASLIWLSDH